MAFVGSIAYIAASQVVANLPMITDVSGNSPFSQCMYSHVKVTPASTAVTCAVQFDNKPGVTYSTVGLDDIWAIPVGAKVMTVTPTGGSATAQLGRAM